ncbi:MAG: aminomethyltransferase, partial [Nitrospinaceae bacterium]|nr:folate-binding protein YgfZ [Nitrospinaceae bacterium]NIR54567.1 folate-binding protein YgfZ [Nitrospinaceae bacterium]NIS84986.1 folate-binding protein YgfZ [Nitrospinaceae bacterium]NIT81797.1 folate-binding protein YgfZ [Nitrospinaceae bacterium]NIU44063.1 folate-binding protein YgfZ [Nitrospinaceae bacterium]
MESALTVKEEHQQVRRKCGYFWMEDWALAQATGKDVFEYLQTQTTNDIKNLEIGQGQASAIVDRKARLIAPFSVFRTSENTVLFLVQAEIQERLLRHLETFLFREDVTIKSLSEKLLAFQGPLSALVMKQLTGLDSLPEKPNDWASSRWEGKEIQVIHKSFTGEEGYLLVLNPALKDKTISRIQELDPPHQCLPISLDTWDVLRIEAGIPLYGRDMSDKNILPETGLEHTSVSYHKGCYIGQEVIARIKTYGAPNFALMGLEIEGEDLPPENAEIRWNNKKIGTLKST